MSRDNHKFVPQTEEQWVPHDCGKVYAHQGTSSAPKVTIAASHDGSRLLRELSLILREPFFLLYVLILPRGGSVEGRYQSEELSRIEIDSLFDRFGNFWDDDGRHSV